MSKKKEKAREYTENILSPCYPMVDSYFNSYELEDAFEAGWDAAVDKVCEFIRTNVREYHKSGVFHVAEFIKDIKKFVKE